MAGRRELRERGEAIHRRLFDEASPAEPMPGYGHLALETTYGSIWNRPGLPLPDRMVCTLAALCAIQRLATLPRYVAAALRIGMPAAAPFEVFLQIGIYAGFSAAEEAAAAVVPVYRDRGVALPSNSVAEAPLEELERRGRELMHRLHGKGAVQGYAAPENPLTNRLYPMTIPYGYGEIWQRPGLEIRQRALCSVAGFAALQLQDSLRKFGRAAVNLGLSMDEVVEGIIQTAPYSGYPRALNALRWLSEP
jgi:alkylhydroperoxidase/carboxymuconolactone decarboxylase family protein YurZ